VAAACPASPVIASVLVPVPVVGRVPVPVVQEVGVPLVRHRDVAAARPVLVGVALVGRVAGCRALVDVIAVNPVNVPVVGVIGVIPVRERDVATALAMGVVVTGVRGVLKSVRHGDSPPCGERLAVAPPYMKINI
jgi:hypothetical protein